MSDELKELALWAKTKEIEALEKSKQFKNDPQGYGTFQGRASAYSDIWERIVFNGRSVPNGTIHPEMYNRKNDKWSRLVAAQRELMAEAKQYIEDDLSGMPFDEEQAKQLEDRGKEIYDKLAKQIDGFPREVK